MKKQPLSDLISKVYLSRRAFVTNALKNAIDILADHSTVQIEDHLFSSDSEFNGWVVPKKWEVQKAKILFKNKLVYDGTAHPLGVITHCAPFQGNVSLEELKKHVFVASSRPNAIPFHFRFMYRPWESDWGFCMPKSLLDSLENGEYRVDIETTFTPDKMIVREFILEGESSESIVFAAHIDHAGQANDDVAGCVVGLQLLEEIKAKYPKRKYTYHLILTQEIVGSVFYLQGLSKKKLKQIKFSMFLEMLGNDNTLNLQKSLKGDTYIDKVSQLALQNFPNTRTCGFRESAGNDEIVFEAPGYEIPMPSLSRWPYDEYHTSDDNMEIISEDKLQESLDYLMDVVQILENDCMPQRLFTGLVSLANPKYDLYIDPGQIINNTLGQNSKKASFQYKMPNYLDGVRRISDLATEFGLDFKWLHSYFQKMQAKKLVKLIK